MKGSKWGKYLKAPIRALCSVRDLYIKGMNNCAGSGSGSVGCYPTLANQYSHSYSFSSARSSASDEDFRELIRAASVSKMRATVAATTTTVTVRRSQSVVVGRIDEDEPCEFKEDVKVGEDLLFPRSQSYAVGMKSRRVKVFA